MSNVQNPAIGPQQPAVGGTPVAFDRASAVRIETAVKYVERIVRGGQPLPTNRQPVSFLGGTLAKLTSTLTAASGTSPRTYGTATATLQVDSGTSLSNSADPGDIGVTVKNLINKAGTNGSYVVVLWALGSWWVVAIDDCTHLT